MFQREYRFFFFSEASRKISIGSPGESRPGSLRLRFAKRCGLVNSRYCRAFGVIGSIFTRRLLTASTGSFIFHESQEEIPGRIRSASDKYQSSSRHEFLHPRLVVVGFGETRASSPARNAERPVDNFPSVRRTEPTNFRRLDAGFRAAFPERTTRISKIRDVTKNACRRDVEPRAAISGTRFIGVYA